MKVYLSIVAIITSISLYSQNIQGEIKSQKNTPIENATLYNLNNHSHIHTDEEGKFILESFGITNSTSFGNSGIYSLK